MKLLRDRVGRIETHTTQRAHRGVIWANSDAERDAEIARRMAAGELSPLHGLLVVPRSLPQTDEGIAAWEAQYRAAN